MQKRGTAFAAHPLQDSKQDARGYHRIYLLGYGPNGALTFQPRAEAF